MMRDYFGMKEKMTGIVVTRVYKLSRRIKTLMENDVLLAVNGNPIQNDGEVSIGINLEGFIALKKPMENVCFDVLRKGVISQMTLRLSNMDNSQDGRDYPPPTYFIVGGFVFTNSEDGVKISQVLENEVNIGYTIFRDSVVVMVNGEVVYNVKAMRKMIEEAKKCPITTHVRLLLHCGNAVILNLKSVEETQDDLLGFHKVNSAMSHDMTKTEDKEDEDFEDGEEGDEDEDDFNYSCITALPQCKSNLTCVIKVRNYLYGAMKFEKNVGDFSTAEKCTDVNPKI